MTTLIPRSIRWALTLLTAITVPCLGYSWILGAHPAPGDNLPWYVVTSVPFAAFGPGVPSWTVFALLAFLNALLWGTAAHYAQPAINWAFAKLSKDKPTAA